MGYKTDALKELTTISQIQSHIMASYALIESELGQHPCYRKTQRLLSDARSMLDNAAKEARESIAFTTSPEQRHAMSEHANFVAKRDAAGEEPL